MSSTPSSENNSGAGCGILFLAFIFFGAVVWSLAVLLYLLGFVAIVGGVVLGIMLILRARKNILRKRDVAKIDDIVLEMSNECVSSISSTITDIDYMLHTKGIGQGMQPEQFQEVSDKARDIRRRLEGSRMLLQSEPALEHRIDAIIEAEQLQLKARNILNGDSSKQ